ncbi:MAG TPA: CIA30 family protein, partial [Thermoanaerobaculia bacterium]|nr:CIA30 family protein [Thermoanaerobaculia bacterium]
THVRIFDGSKVIPDGTVVIEGRTIRAVGAKVAVPAGAEVIDGSGDTLLPGFIDGHTHTWGDALTRAAIFGVTTELDMFTSPDFARAQRDEQAKTGAPGRADLLSAGYLATAPGGHGTEYGMSVPTLTKPEEAQAWVDARIAEGSDYIKIISENGKLYGHEIPTLDKATIAAIVQAAHKRGKLAVVHISTEDAAKEALEAGADGLVHIFTDRAPEAGFVALAVKHKAFVTPTLTVVESTTGATSGASLTNDPRLSPYLTSDEVMNLRKQFPKHGEQRFQNALDAVRQLKAAGVPILAGTDAPNPGTAHGPSIHRELELLVQAGLSPAEALAAATSVPAKTFGLKDRGSISPGLRADLVLVKGDPTASITASRDILKVWKIGQEIPRPKAPKNAEATAAPAQVPATGEISNFEDGTLKASFGSGWQDSTDKLAGGVSVVQKEVVAGGASGTAKSLAISGEVKAGFAFPWSGMIFLPGAAPMAPANLSKFQGVSFWTKGDGRSYELMFFATRLGRMPAIKNFTAGPDWTQVTVPFGDLNLDGSDIMGIFVGGGPALGTFRFQVDEVRLVPKGGGS